MIQSRRCENLKSSGASKEARRLAGYSETDEGASDESVREFIRRFIPWFIPNSLLFWGLRRVIFGQSCTEKTLADVVCRAGFRNIEYQRVPACPYVLIKARK